MVEEKETSGRATRPRPEIFDFDLKAPSSVSKEPVRDDTSSKRRILVIAGSDSSGGAGLEADQKVIAAHGCYAMTATTALTAQNTQGVHDIHHIPPKFVCRQIDACIDDIGVDVIKIGMLASAETVQAVAETLKRQAKGCPLILDPVMVSTTGSQLLPQDAVFHLLQNLVPIATVITPNIPEAKLMIQREKDPNPQTQEEIIELAKELHKLGPKYVLVKGGHFQRGEGRNEGGEDKIVDVLYDGKQATLVKKEYLDGKNTHGTGCSLASAIACYIALGNEVQDAVHKACRYVEAGIKMSIDRGKGSGPINHFHSSYHLPFVPGRYVEYLLSRISFEGLWKEQVKNDFVEELAHGTLSTERFKLYLAQDYLFLVQLARLKALAASKAKSLEDTLANTDQLLGLEKDINSLNDYWKLFEITEEKIEATETYQALVACTSCVHDIGNSEDWLGLQTALWACSAVHFLAIRKLYDETHSKTYAVRDEENRYRPWIDNLFDQERLRFIIRGRDLLERHAVLQSPSRIEELVKIFDRTTRLAIDLWEI